MNRVTRYQKLSSSIKKTHAKSLIGVVQCRSTSDLETNLEQNTHYILECIDRGASLICLPEYFAYMNHPAIPDGWHEPLTGQVIKHYRKIALDNACWLSLGGFQESVITDPELVASSEEEDAASQIRRELGFEPRF
mmetsp:Transcript_7985/g.12348  ORF Transcript_7985/g.12348 Transcript_7985/m.12348 type:complete len:136 (+) Transcript_7985:10-417(+)